MLTETQIATLRTAVMAEPTLDTARVTGDDYAIAAWCNAVASPDYKVWNTTTPTATIGDAITWGNLTPVDTPDGTATFTNRALAAQAKQLNLQILIQGRETLSSGRSNIRAGLQDALTDLPTGTSGALRSGGWPAVKSIIQRNATNAEKILTSGAGTATTPSTLVFEGQVTPNEASLLR
ncbi:hypothetical protein [Candidatus Accumulibacter contiguus]|jgi:hypothetical protein|uniref:hypothetical protein n=1 Tax=Candidatus Accumulibacter contiguus TaxID=2954381 RepID=UPI002FC2D34D